MVAITRVHELDRKRFEIHGAVQGVGFRPHVYRLAEDLGLGGWVVNGTEGVIVEVEGEHSHLETFARRLEEEAPACSVVEGVEVRDVDPRGSSRFEIKASNKKGRKSVLMQPDIALCPDCLRELLDPQDRRYRYPFINCTHCGPRFSIIESLPYDRPNTTMDDFEMCSKCRSEYEDPRNRRFHAQPIACPDCGPSISFRSKEGVRLSAGEDALAEAVTAIRNGKILALKGLGGYQLVVDARNVEAVDELRKRKGRGPKPFAIMCPNLLWAGSLCCISDRERKLLTSTAAPIVLLRRRDNRLDHVAPGIRELGIMLPYTPLHQLLMRDFGGPVVATSANLSEEPICIGNAEAVRRLAGIADAYLAHNRRIARHVDDSVVRVICGDEQILRRARGYAPTPITIKKRLPAPTLAVGAHLKNAVALGFENKLLASQYIGDLETVETLHAFRRSAEDLPRIYDKAPKVLAHDCHPDYASTRFAKSTGKPTVAVQHHLAHVFACMADRQLSAPVLGISWDGVGYGDDGSLWGGESFLVKESDASRVSSLQPFPLIGGDAAAREPRRVALALLLALDETARKSFVAENLETVFSRDELKIFPEMARNGLSSPSTSSIGRLFDGVSSLLGLVHHNEYEGQAAMILENVAYSTNDSRDYFFELVNDEQGVLRLDWRPVIRGIVEDMRNGVSVAAIANGFHTALAKAIVAIAERMKIRSVVLSGGCFQNRKLTELAVTSLLNAEFEPHIHRLVPPNDGGIAIGQLYAQCV